MKPIFYLSTSLTFFLSLWFPFTTQAQTPTPLVYPRMAGYLGVLVNLGHDFTLASRLAFETSGRYGFTPVLNKLVKKGPTISYFAAIPIPVRFGNDRPTSLTVGLQFGVVF